MHIEALHAFCSQLDETEACFPFGPDTLVFKTRGKIFLLAGLNNQPLQFNVKCIPEKAVTLRDQYPCVLPGYHMNKKHWNTVVVDGSVSSGLLKEWILDSYHLVYGK